MGNGNYFYVHKEDVLFELIDLYPSLPNNENKVMIHNAVMNVLEGNKGDKRIFMLFDISQNKYSSLHSHLKTLTKCNPYLGLMNWVTDIDSVSEGNWSPQPLQHTTTFNFTEIILPLRNAYNPHSTMA